MTAEPRDVEEIRGDGKITDEALGDAIDMGEESWFWPVDGEEFSVADVLRELQRTRTRLAAADRENAELRGEVERLRDLVARQLGDCIGCSPQTGPEETCPHDGRTYTEWVEIASMVIGRQHANEAERDDLRAQIAAAQAQLAGFTAENRYVWDQLDAEIDKRCDAEARLEAVRAASREELDQLLCDALPESDGLSVGQVLDVVMPWLAALSAAPQPEPGAEVGYSLWLDRESWGHVIDGLIRERADAMSRKAANSESTSGGRAVEIADVIVNVSAADPLRQPEPPASDEPAPSWHVSPDTPDLMAALRASVEAAKKRRTTSDEPARCAYRFTDGTMCRCDLAHGHAGMHRGPRIDRPGPAASGIPDGEQR